MLKKGNLTVLAMAALIFVGFGDSFLPKPLSNYSFQTRNTINQFVIGLFPQWRPKTKPYERTEQELENLQNNGSRKK